jgi:AraC-like DNA-binding protein
MSTPDPHSTRGILAAGSSGEPLPWRGPPAPELAPFVEYFWSTWWDLEAPVVRETLPFPSLHLSIRAGQSGVHGLVRRKFSITLEGRGSVVAARFRPGGLFPFYRRPVSALTDRRVPVESVFGPDGAVLEAEVLSRETLPERVAAIESFLLARLPEPDPNVELVAGIVQRIAGDRSITRVEAVVEHAGIPPRTLQRLFGRYVGAGPKWVIQRYRLQEAAERLAREGTGRLSWLALELGYTDQAHFIKDFRAIIGATPTEYARRARQGVAAADSAGRAV